MIGKLLALVIVVGGVAFGGFWFLTMPRTIAPSAIPERVPDLANGAIMFWAGGCESCHAAATARGDDQLKLGGGQVLSTPLGRFHVPNISPDPEHGIGRWTPSQFVSAMKYGVAPGDVHLYPAFPYPAYQRMRIEDILDLKGFLDSLPPVADRSQPHELAFPYNLRRGIGLWKLLYANGEAFAPDPAADREVNRGAYLVTGPGHCGECHTPRSFIGGPISNRAFSGGPAFEGTGTIPNITPHPTGIADWSEADIVSLLETGFTPSFEPVGKGMAAVVRSLAHLPKADLAAIAAYLKTLPPVASRPSAKGGN